MGLEHVIGSCVFGSNSSIYPTPTQPPMFTVPSAPVPASKSVAEMKAMAYELASKGMVENTSVEAIIARAEVIFAWLFPSARPKPSSDRMAVGE